MPSIPLPSFESPPVVETALGVEFAALPKWGLPFFGLYWNKIRSDYPKYEVQPPLMSQVETFDPAQSPAQASFQFVASPEARCWYIGKDDKHLIQLQNDRFLFNWRQGETAGAYPRYDEFVRPKFIAEWARFLDFLESESLDRPEVVQCEVTYVNHILKGGGWETIGDWKDVFTVCGVTRNHAFLPALESFRLNCRYIIPERKGRLHVNAHHAVRIFDQNEVIVFTLTARGKPESAETDDILKWLDLGREWVVRGFADLTSDKMHQLWGWVK